MFKQLRGLFTRNSSAAARSKVARAVDANEIAARVDTLYQEASTAWQKADPARALSLAGEALTLDDTLPALHYLQGSALFSLGRHDEAAKAMERCLALNPRFPLVLNAEVHAALAAARADMARGRKPSDEPGHDGPAKRISVVICSVTPEKFDRVSANYHHLLKEVPHEIIGIHDARSICEGYNRGLQKSTGDLLVFSHDDIEVCAPDFADRLQNRLQMHSVVGVAGTTKLAGNGWVYSRWPHIHGQVGMPPEPGNPGIAVTAFHMRGPATAGAQALDGLFLACRREVAEALRFDEDTFDGWHLYDFDFSFRAWHDGYATAVCHDFLVIHASRGSFGADWLRYSQRFIDKHREALGATESLGQHEPPQLASVMVQSVDEWRLFTERMCARTDVLMP